jgi:hypothetical protein
MVSGDEQAVGEVQAFTGNVEGAVPPNVLEKLKAKYATR